MKIAIVNNDYGLGGLQRVTTVIGKGLEKRHNVYFYSMFSKENFYEIENNFVIGQVLIDRNRLLQKCWRATRLIEQLFSGGEYTPSLYALSNLNKLIAFVKTKSIDCLVVSGPELTAYIPYIKKKLPRLAIIAWQHNNANIYIDDYAKKYKTEYLRGLKQASHVICLTDSDCASYKMFADSVTRIYNPLTINNETISTLESKVISFVGRIDIQHKGIDYLVEIASKLPAGWKISVAGTGNKIAMQELEKLVAKYGSRNKFVFRGALTGKALQEHYLTSSMYVMTSRWEGFGLVLPEAMSFGLPIISFENLGSNEVLRFGEYGVLVESGNVEKMTEELFKMINSDTLKKSYQIKSLTRVKDFSLEKIIPQWEKILSNV